jgi:anti-anti-sigma factor
VSKSILSIEMPVPISGIVVVVCCGEVDVSVCAELRAALDQAVAHGAIRGLRVDMSSVGFIDSNGIGCLLEARRRCDGAGLDFQVVASPAVRRLTDIVALSEYLHLTGA